ncbi:MAG: hypothetical protein R3B82_15980 [Sandaracinaceae bacterium]
MADRQRAGIVLGWVAMLAALFAVALANLAGEAPESTDDAFIVMVYARHLLADGSLYWNAADGPVEGFTSPLQLLVTAGLAGILGDVVLACFAGAVAALLGAVAMASALAWHALRHASARTRWLGAAGAGLLLATSPDLAHASSFLLETPLFVLTVLGALAIADRPPASRTPRLAGALSAVLAALVLVRPEGAPLALIVAAAWTWGADARSRFVPLAITGGVLVAQLVFRLAVFGVPLPNTFYAKSSASRLHELADGWRYLTDAADRPAVLALGLAVVAGWLPLALPGERSEQRARHLALWAATVVSVVVVVLGGGDCYPGTRFLVVPIVLGLATLGAAAAREGAVRFVALGALGALLLFQLSGLASGWETRRERLAEWPPDRHAFPCDEEPVRRIEEAWPGASVAQSDFQCYKLFSDRTHVQDLHGLNDPVLAHEPFPGPVLHGKYSHAGAARNERDIWIWGYMYRRPRPMSDVPLAALLSDPAEIEYFSGYPASYLPDEATRARMRARWRTASVESCGTQFNFLVRRSLPPPPAGSPIRVEADVSRIVVDAGEPEARPHLAEGFSFDERDGDRSFVWSTGPRSVLRLAGLPVDRPLELVLVVSAVPSPHDEGLDVTLVADAPLEGLHLEDDVPARIVRRVPAGALEGGRLELRYGWTFQPPRDDRSLAMKLEWLCVGPPGECRQE